MNRKTLTEIVADLTGQPFGSIRNLVPILQDADLMTMGVQGRRDDLSITSRVNLLLAAVLDCPRGVWPADNVKAWRDLPMTSATTRGEGLSEKERVLTAWGIIPAESDLGAALEAVFEFGGAVEFYGADRAVVHIASSSFEFGGKGELPAIERIIRINRAAFEKLR
jgi:hypothetical protein